MNLQLIPSDQFTQAKDLLNNGFSYQELKEASSIGGILERVVKKISKRDTVFYRSKNLTLPL